MPTDLRQAVVTGSSSGIGHAIARRLLEDGWQVCGIDAAPAVIEHAQFSAVQLDLLDMPAVRAMLDTVAAPHALVHAAGVLRTGRLGQLDLGDADAMWQLHVRSATQLADRWLPAMAAAGAGRVVLIGSRVSRGIAGRSQYAATKAAIASLARSWAAEVVSHGVTVNVVSPAATRTAMLADPARASVAPRVPPMGRLIEPAEVASLAAFLLSPDAAAITGQDIQVCGGSSLER